MKLKHIFLAAFILVILGSRISFASDRFSKERYLEDDQSPWQITAKSLSYSAEEGIYLAEGDVVFTKGNQTLYAQKARYNVKAGIAEVSGDVRLESGEDILRGERGFFDLKNKTGRIDNGSLFLSENHYYVNGRVMEKVGENTYLVKDCQLTTCDGPNPAWSITGSEVRVTIEGYGKAKHTAFRVRGVPLFYVPYMIFPAKTKRQTGLLPPSVGYSTRNGIDTEVPFFWAISDQTDATFYQRFMSERGYMQGLEFRYLADENSRGSFLFDILSDRKNEKDMNDPDDMELSPFARTNRTRYWFRGRANQDLPLGLEARLDTDLVSDQDYLREFEGGLFGLGARPVLAEESGRPFEEEKSPTRRSALRLSRDGKEYSLQALASYYQRPENPSEDQTAQPLAGLNFSLLPQKVINSPVFFSLGSGYDYVWRDVGQKGHSLSLSPELRTPLWLGRFIEFEPSFRYTYNAQWLDEDEGNADHYSKKAYEAGARLATSAERIYDIQWRNARRLKHKISPVLSYRYRVNQDEEEESPWFEPIDEEGKINHVTLSLENYLDARLENKKGEITYRQWGFLSLSQGYDIDEVRRNEEPGIKKKPFEPLTGLLILRPFQDIDILSMAKWDHYDNKITFADVSLDLSLERSGGRKDLLRLDYRYERDSQKSLNLWLRVNLVHGFSVGGSLERDLDLDYTISNRYWLDYQGQCWGVRFGVHREDDDTRVMLLFRILGLGDIKTL